MEKENLPSIKSDRQKEHLNHEDENFFFEIKKSFEIINEYANDPSEEKEVDLFIALKYILNYLKSIQNSSNPSDLQYEPIIPSLIQIFLNLDIQSDRNAIFLELFHRITTMLSNTKIYEYFSNKELCDKLFNLISFQSPFSDASSRVVSHLIISNTIIDFYDIPDLLKIAPFINNLPDRAFFLYTLPEINIPSELFFDFLQIVVNTFDINEYETIEYCCQSICNCINDTLENEHFLPLDQLNDLFEPFLFSIQPELDSILLNKKIVKFIIELFECFFDNTICTQFFSNSDFISQLCNSSINCLLWKKDADGEYFFKTIFPFYSDIIKKCRLYVTNELLSTITSVALEGTFKVREPAFLFIADVIDQIITESPEFFEDTKFYELLIEMMSSSIDNIMNQIIECISKLLSTQIQTESGCMQRNFAQYIKELPDDLREEFMTELDRIENETNDSNVSRNVIYIKRTLRQSLPRPYDVLYDVE